MRVGEHMTPDPVTVSQQASMREAVMLLRQHHIRHLPVVDGTSLVGIVTDRDIRRASPSLLSGVTESEYEGVLNGTAVSRIMTRDPLTVKPETDLVEAVRLMVEKKIGGLPVVRNGNLVGIFTEVDALRVLLELLSQHAR